MSGGQRKLVLVGGYGAGGKTTFSLELSQRFRIPCFNKDLVKEVLAGKGIGELGIENQMLSDTTFSLMVHIGENLMKVGSPFLLESNFRPGEGDVLRELKARYGYESLTFILAGEISAIHKRFLERDSSPDRHPIHKSHNFSCLADFEAAVRPLKEFDPGGERVFVDTTDFSKVDYHELYDRVERFLRDDQRRI